MVIVRLRGGLGNQLFQYAFGRAIAIQKQADLFLDLGWYRRFHMFCSPRNYELDCYPIHAQIAPLGHSILALACASPVIGMVLQKLSSIQYISECLPNLHLNDSKEIVILDGYWQSQDYFSGIRKLLVKEFTPFMTLDRLTAQLRAQIQRVESVAIHIRRGDYVSNDRASNLHGILPISYYQEALKRMNQRVCNPHYFIFSDDMAWVKNHLFMDGCEFTLIESTPEPVAVRELELMRLCKHHIIANSSFSWWGAWLGASEEQVVIAPSQWFASKLAPKNLLPEKWMIFEN